MSEDTLLGRDVDAVCELATSKKQDGTKTIIGIAGPPASGKSTLAEAVVQSLNRTTKSSEIPVAALLPMDGYHLDNNILEARGLLATKGAPDTFNAYGFCEEVERVATANVEIFCPRFSRKGDLAIANAIVIHPQTPIVIVEGNYLLLNSDPWVSLGDVFAATVFISPAMDELRDRLQKRWIQYGLDEEAALERATTNDLPNAELILRDSREADVVLQK